MDLASFSLPSDDEVHAMFPLLPQELPALPGTLLQEWYDFAQSKSTMANPNAMALATVDGDGRPSVRYVLCKVLAAEEGWLRFFSNRMSRKGQAMAASPRVAAVFYWDEFDRQVRIEGQVRTTRDEISDAYFASRSVAAQLGARASRQSQALSDRSVFLDAYADEAQRCGVVLDGDGKALSGGPVARPPQWGGYEVDFLTVELWCGNRSRLHDRAVWSRGAVDAKEWAVHRLYP